MSLGEFDKSARRRPQPIKGSEYELDIDTLIPAIGQKPDLDFLQGNTKLNISKWNTLEVDPDTMETNIPGIFAGGDVVTGPATVLEAMRAGKIASESIHKYLRGESISREYSPKKPRLDIPPIQVSPEELSELKRPEIPTLSIEERKSNFKEVELGLTKEMAIQEAKRCLRCDLENKGE
jgi:NADPH-dependent glutamate synthase beta subunit-like oxidoreductase